MPAGKQKSATNSARPLDPGNGRCDRSQRVARLHRQTRVRPRRDLRVRVYAATPGRRADTAAVQGIADAQLVTFSCVALDDNQRCHPRQRGCCSRARIRKAGRRRPVEPARCSDWPSLAGPAPRSNDEHARCVAGVTSVQHFPRESSPMRGRREHVPEIKPIVRAPIQRASDELMMETPRSSLRA